MARQLRLRDLAGLIVIDFIDMEERRNNASVEKRFKDRLKTDRARIQVGRISGFGLLEMSRQRLRPGMLEATTQPCRACHGTGLIRSDDSLGLNILRQLEEEGVRRRSREASGQGAGFDYQFPDEPQTRAYCANRSALRHGGTVGSRSVPDFA